MSINSKTECQISVFIFNRNRAKQNSFTKLNLVFVLMKTIFDTTSRILLFSAWLYVVNDGQFSTLKTLIAYYTTAIVLFIFNVSCNTKRPSCSSSFWIGKMIYILNKSHKLSSSGQVQVKSRSDQASPIDKPKSKSQVQAQSQIEKGKTNFDSGLSLKSYGPPNHHHPTLNF